METENAVVAVTGASGYLGSRLTELLEQDARVKRIVGIDRVPPKAPTNKLKFYQRDINDAELSRIFGREGVTHVAHLAFLLAPNHNRARTQRINVGGTENVLRASAASQVRQFVLASSSVVYGAHADNRLPVPETTRLRPSRQVQYTLDKVAVEKMCASYQRSHAEMNFSVMRVVTIVGPGTDNFITRFLANPFLIVPRGFDPPWQFVHELDCARAFQTALFSGQSGTFNLGANDPFPFSEIIARLDKPVLRVPRRALKLATNLAWYARLRFLTEIPGALIDYLCFPPVLDNSRIKQQLGFEFQFSSRETIASYLNGKQADEPSRETNPEAVDAAETIQP